jgi:hypothetical protein
MTDDRKVPPDWCEKPLEQVILEPDAKPDIRPDEDARLVRDGNMAAELHVLDRSER